MSGKNQIAAHKKADTALAKAVAVVIDHDSFGEVSKEDIAIPFLTVLQPLSPQCTPGHAKEVEGARPGMIFQTVTGEVFTALRVVPAEYRRTFIEWVPRNKGGGFRGEHGTEWEKIFESNRKGGRAILENDNELADTRSWYVMALRDDGSRFPAVISMGSTQIGTSKKWGTMQMTPPPGHEGPLQRSSYTWHMGTQLQKNDKGSWFGWTVRRGPAVTDEALARDCAGFRQQVRGGAITVDHEQGQDAGQEPDGDAM